MSDYLTDLFINEAKPALKRASSSHAEIFSIRIEESDYGGFELYKVVHDSDGIRLQLIEVKEAVQAYEDGMFIYCRYYGSLLQLLDAGGGNLKFYADAIDANGVYRNLYTLNPISNTIKMETISYPN